MRKSVEPTSVAPQNGGVGEQVDDLVEEKKAVHPLTIQALKNRTYEGGKITIEQTVASSGPFTSYIISYPSDGLKLRALMNVPTSTKPANGFPVIMLNHGFITPTEYSTTTSYKSLAEYYPRYGYIVVKPDYRGHDQSEGEPTNVRLSHAYTHDVLNLVASIKKYNDADPNKIGMWGHSMGGGITLNSLIASNDIKAAVLWAGVIGTGQDMIDAADRKYPGFTPPTWITLGKDVLISQLGTPQENPQLWHDASAPNFVHEIATPIQIHHGSADPDVPIQFSENLDKKLKEANKQVEYFSYQGAGHNFTGPERGVFLQRTLEFFDSYLKE